jgi:ATP-dependent RNA helicase DDX24/MAK5
LLQVVVATPGRLWDLMREGHRHVTDLSHLSFLVIDEAGELSLA